VKISQCGKREGRENINRSSNWDSSSTSTDFDRCMEGRRRRFTTVTITKELQDNSQCKQIKLLSMHPLPLFYSTILISLLFFYRYNQTQNILVVLCLFDKIYYIFALPDILLVAIIIYLLLLSDIFFIGKSLATAFVSVRS